MYMYENMQFQKKSTPAPWKVIGNSQGEGVLKTKILKQSTKQNWNFLGGGGRGCRTKNFPWGEYGYFPELHNLILDEGLSQIF